MASASEQQGYHQYSVRRASFFSKLAQRANYKTSFAPVVLLLLACLMSAISGLSANWQIDIFAWLSTSFLFSSLFLFAAQLLLGLYHLLTGKGEHQGTITDINLPDQFRKKTSFLPFILIAMGLLLFVFLLFRDLPSSQSSWLDKILAWATLFLLSSGMIWLIWNFVFGVYLAIRDTLKRQPSEDD
ncbi:MAG: hypothetical protein IGS03_03250 [Candidatus Sericytochromatia bacterium]|nr:hypothetical protein [Candidatus Sericytochromatia bacterium]